MHTPEPGCGSGSGSGSGGICLQHTGDRKHTQLGSSLVDEAWREVLDLGGGKHGGGGVLEKEGVRGRGEEGERKKGGMGHGYGCKNRFKAHGED